MFGLGGRVTALLQVQVQVSIPINDHCTLALDQFLANHI